MKIFGKSVYLFSLFFIMIIMVVFYSINTNNITVDYRSYATGVVSKGEEIVNYHNSNQFEEDLNQEVKVDSYIEVDENNIEDVTYDSNNDTLYDEEAESQNIIQTDDFIKTKSSISSEKKNGWYKTKNGKKVYYKNGAKLTNTFVNYTYLNNKGVAQEKIGSFSATLYGSRAWANQTLNIRKKASSTSSKIGTIPTGAKMIILSKEDANTKYIKIRYNNIVGYVYSLYIYINLPDVIPDAVYEITNASKSIYKSAGKKISGVTGENLYGYTKKYNAKIGKNTYYAPLLYPVAKQLQRAYNKAKRQGYNLKIYDTYRPYDVSLKINSAFKNLYNSNNNVRKKINYDKSGQYWGPSWFLADNISRHNQATAIDLTLTDKNNNELSAQTPIHTLDTRSLTKYNNAVAKKLKSIMTSAGFETLKSEWWHFQENNYKNSPCTSFKIK